MIRLPFLLLLLLSVAFTITAKEIPGFWSLNCGGEGFEAKNNITWVSDKDFVRTGVIREGQTNGTHLRVFPTKKKNCYTVPVRMGVRILERLTFYYGNYDGLGSPPEMRLIFDGHDSGTFQTTMEGGEFVEVIYVTKRNNTSICFGRTSSDQDPFAHKIEVRSLDLGMYTNMKEFLRLMIRDAYGADDVIQYPNDVYDRMWLPRSEGFTVVRRNDSYITKTSWPEDDPPRLITQSAVGPLDMTSRILSISLSNLPEDSITILFNIYFSEMLNTKKTNDGRSFDVFIGEVRRSGYPITPPYQSSEEQHISGIEANQETKVELVQTNSATLPPIVSALEIYRMEYGIDMTFLDDVVALRILQERFEILQEWTGDPCFPEDYNWEWVGCGKARVNKLNLAGFGLSGELPDFRDLDQLVSIDMRNNNLSGAIPEFFNNFKYLTKLNLANNKFTSVPPSLLNNEAIALDISGNPMSLSPPGLRGKKERKTRTLVIVFCIAVVVVMVYVAYIRRSPRGINNT